MSQKINVPLHGVLIFKLRVFRNLHQQNTNFFRKYIYPNLLFIFFVCPLIFGRQRKRHIPENDLGWLGMSVVKSLP